MFCTTMIRVITDAISEIEFTRQYVEAKVKATKKTSVAQAQAINNLKQDEHMLKETRQSLLEMFKVFEETSSIIIADKALIKSKVVVKQNIERANFIETQQALIKTNKSLIKTREMLSQVSRFQLKKENDENQK